MKQYIAVVSHSSGLISKYQDFDTQTEADAHVVSFGGKVVEGLDGDLTYWNVSGDTPVKDTVSQDADAVKRAALSEIARLESLETPRRMADAALGDTTWLQANRDLIAIERAKL